MVIIMEDEIKNLFENKEILITGGTGSIGSEILKKVLEYNPKVVRILDVDETKQFELGQKLKSHKNIRFLIGDIRDKERLRRAIENIDIVFHAAALKHVPLCEYNAFEAVKTNVLGTQNLIEVALDEKIEKMITISTDKTVNPINVMGATKLLAERLTTSANYYKGNRETIFSCIRFGNVLNSRGSIVPLLKEQIRNGGPVTITDLEMTRFVMKMEEAIELVLKATKLAKGGEIFILKMPALRIKDLVSVMIEQLASKYGHDPKKIKLKITGIRPGEKIHEELITEEESKWMEETEEMFKILSPIESQTNSIIKKLKLVQTKRYTSRDTYLLTKKEINVLLKGICRYAIRI